MPQDLRKQCGEEASHLGQRRRPPPHRPARAGAPPEACPPRPGLRWGARCPRHTVHGRGAGPRGRPLTSPSPRSRLLPARLQSPGRESCKRAHCRVRRSATAQGPARGESAVQRGAQNASRSRPVPPEVRSRDVSRHRRDPGRREPGLRRPGDPACCPRGRAAGTCGLQTE